MGDAAPYYWSQTMSAGMHESHHQPRSKITGHGGREKEEGSGVSS